MKARFGVTRRMALGVAALAAIAVSSAPGPASAATADSEHWGVITRNTIGSPVAELRNGPYGSFGKTGPTSKPPYGKGSLGIEVANNSTTLTPPSEKVDFGNEVDFYGDPVLGLNQVGFYVFQTGENISYGGASNMPNIRFEIDPNLSSTPTNYSTMTWLPDPVPMANVDAWSPYLNAATSGKWMLSGAAGTATGCNQTTQCTFSALKAALNDGGDAPTILTAAVGKGRDNMWIGAVDGLRINQKIYDFEANGVVTRSIL
ncbi:hypothetical protein [Streptomyces sp. WMMB 322]|uniref:hypothetical protein n=1 Tax=Streptomyces sp. WMMB 322 TaxID=1286821 RepID=UPI000823BB90|nr:hypothetical protein [Streptomyces sp. WMMB 322]SCK31435.1 hypothetical protein H180DRAFT_02500 [Streptomyces sp. WMMB 322]